MPTREDRFYKQSSHLNALLDQDPSEAVRQAREIDLAIADAVSYTHLTLPTKA